MRGKHILVLCFIFVLIGSLSFVNAQDNNANAVSEALGDETLSMENNVRINETSTLLQNNDNTLKAGEDAFGSFADLNETISSADSIITLNRDYIFNQYTDFDLQNGIVISKDLTINGNNHYIDADYNSIRIFTTSSNVVLNNITFKNSRFTEEGSAILAQSSIIINGCTFDDNGPGSAVSLKADNSYINNSKFTDNIGHAVTVDSKNNHIQYSYFKNNEEYDVFISDDQSAYLNYNVFLDSNPFNLISPQYFRSNWYGSNKPLQSGLNYLEASLDYNLEDNVLTGGIIFSESDTGTVIDVPWSRVVTYTVDFKTIIGDTLNPFSFSNISEGFVINAFIDGQRLTNYDGRIWYVNSSVSSSGSGTQDSPFKIIKNAFDAASDGDTIYIAPGVYKEWNDLDLVIPKSLTVDRWGDDGEVILDSPGWRKFFTINSNVILSSLIFRNGNSVYNGGSIIVNAESVIFNCLFVNSSTKESGGVIDMKSDGTIINCKFINNTSPAGGGAIYTAGINLNIINSIFEDNQAMYGAAVYGESSQSNILIIESVFKNNTGKIGAVRLNGKGDIYDSTFIDNYATLGGGAVAIFDKNHTISNSKFTDNYAGNGGAVLSTKANLTVKNSHFTNNDATTFGGALFNNYGNVSIYESSFKDGNAYYDGGAVYLNQGTNVIYETFFSRNIVGYGGGAIHSLASNLTCARLSMPGNITADINGYVSAQFLNSFIDLGNYTMIVANTSNFNGTLPSYFNLADHGWTTAIRDQGAISVCWDFATIAMVETAVKKASGIELDLSEGNLKNLISVYSMYGENYDPNRGRGPYEGTLYLINSLGPVLESDDPTTLTGFSPLLLNDVIHVSNVAYASRTGFLDNDDVKKAVMKYGGVTATFCSSTPNYNIFHNGTGDNHHEAIIVGWDDNYSKDNFENCSQDGAWIIKNSWGPIGFNNTGYYFLSYYDTTTLFDYMLYVIFNDTIKYDRAYEYDWLCYHMADSGKDTTWYKNVFTSVKDEGITAFSTQFNKIVDWEASVYVNGELKHVQNGSSIGKGFFTYNFDKVIPVRKGDQFEIVVKVNSRNYPITDKHSFNKPCGEFCSYYSTDGINWNDLYYVEGNSVAALKAYTRNLHDSNVEIISAPENATVPALFTVTFNVENRTKVNYVVKNETDDIISEMDISGDTINLEKLPAGNYTLTITNEDSFDYFGSSASFKFRILKATPKITITSSNVTYPNSITVNISSDVSGRYEIKTGNKTLSVNLTENQIQSVDFKDLKPDIYTITVTYHETAFYNNASKNTTAEVYKANSSVEISRITNWVYGSLTPAIDVVAENMTTLTYAILKNGIKIKNGTYDDINNALSKLGAGNYEVIVTNEENDIYNASNDTANFEIKKANSKVVINPIDNVTYGNDIIINVSIINMTGVSYIIIKDENEMGPINIENETITLSEPDAGQYTITITNSESENYTQSSATAEFTVSKATPNVNITALDVVYPNDIIVTLTSDVTGTYAVMVGNETKEINLTANISKGIKFDGYKPNEYPVKLIYNETENYHGINKNISVKVFKANSNVKIINVSSGIYNTTLPAIYVTITNKTDVTYTISKNSKVIRSGNYDELYDYISTLSSGSYTIIITNEGNEIYDASNDTANFEIKKANSKVVINPVNNVAYGNDIIINFNIINRTDVSYTIKKDANEIVYDDIEGKTITLSKPDAGQYTITITNGESENYTQSSATAKFTIQKATPNVNITALDVVYPNDVTVNLTSDVTGTYLVIVGNETKEINLTANISKDIKFEGYKPNEYPVKLIYNETENYHGINKNTHVKVFKANSNVKIISVSPGIYNTTLPAISVNITNKTDVTYTISKNSIEIKSGNFNELYDYISTLSSGNYTIIITNERNEIYDASNDTANFEIKKANSKVVINPIDNVTYGNDIVINFNITNRTGVSYIIRKDANEMEPVNIEGKTITLSKLDAGQYTITITNSESENYTQSSATAEFTVSKATPTITITAENVTYPKDIIVSIKSDVPGIYTIKILDEIKNVTLTSDKSQNVTFGNLNSFTYNITAGYSETENYNGATETVLVNVSKADSSVKITNVLNGTYGAAKPEIKVQIENQTALSYTLTKNTTLIRTDNNLERILSDLNAGKYTITVTNEGNINYNPSNDTANFEIKKATTRITIDPIGNVVYGSNDVINFNVINKTELSYTITKANSPVKTENTDGTIIPLSDLDAGDYTIFISNSENENYTQSSATAEFTVLKAAPNVNITALDVVYPNDVTVALTSDVTGTYLVIVGNKTKEITLTANISKDIKFEGCKPNEYSITLTYNETENYNGINKNINVTVHKANSNVKIINITNGVYNTAAPKINVSFENTTVLTYTLTRNGINISTGNNLDGMLSNLTAGEYGLSIINRGNEIYNSSSDSSYFKIEKATTRITIDTIGNVVYGGNDVINFNVANKTELSYTITKANQSIKTGKTEGTIIPLSDLDAGDYTIFISNSENENFTQSSATAEFTVSKATQNVNITALDVVYPNDITVTLTSDVTGTYTVMVGNETKEISLTAIISKDIIFKGLKPNEYSLTLTYNETENYNSINKKIDVTVYKANSNVKIISVSPGIYNTTLPAISVNITNKTDVTYTISKNGTEIKSGNYNELYNYISTLSSGSYTIKITNEGNEVYGASNDTATFTISKASTKLTIYPIANVTYGNDTIIKFDAVNKTSVTYIITKDGNEIKRQNTDNNEIILTKLDAGSYKITIINSENDNYKSDEKSEEFTVNKISNTDVDVTPEEIEFSYGDAIKIPIENKNAIASVINHPEAVITIENNTAIITNLDSGNYTVNITFPGDENHENTTKLINISINKAKPTITPDNIKIEVVNQQIVLNISSKNPVGVQYHVYDMQGKLIYNYTLYGNENVTSPKLSAGKYSIVISLTGDGNHAGFTKEYSVTVNHEAKIGYFKTKTIIYYMETNKIYVRVVDENNKAISNYPVRFTVAGKVYNIRTDKNGYASVNPTLKPGTHTIRVTVANNTKISKITVKHIIKAKVTTNIKKSKSKTDISISLTGQKIKLSKKVIFKYNGKNKINIKFGSAVKNQKITLTFKGTAYSIIVNKKGIGTLKLSSKTVKKLKKGKKYIASINYKGIKCYKNVKIKIKFNGKTYTAKTDKNGVAKFKVTKNMLKKFKKGKTVSYVISYKNDQLKRFIKIK